MVKYVLIVGFSLFFLTLPPAIAGERCYLEPPSGYQSMGGSSRLGPYSSRSHCEMVNDQYFDNNGTCYCSYVSTPAKPTPSPTPNYQQQPSIDWNAVRRREAEAHRRREQEAAERRERERKVEEARKQQFEQDKQKALQMLKSGSGRQDLKTGSGGTLKLKGAMTDGLMLKEPRFSKGTKQSAPVDHRDKDPSTIPLTLKKTTPEKGIIFREVPSPSGYKSKSERREMAAALSDEHLAKAIEHTSFLLVQMKKEFLGKAGKLEHLLAETQKCEREAVSVSLDLLTAGLIDALPAKTPVEKDMKLVIDRANKLRVHHKALKTGSDVEIGRSVMLDAYDTLADHAEKFISKSGKYITKTGARSASLAAFAFDYSYQVMNWAVSRNQMQMIIDNMDRPNGELDAQKALSRLYEDLVEEKTRRNTVQKTSQKGQGK